MSVPGPVRRVVHVARVLRGRGRLTRVTLGITPDGVLRAATVGSFPYPARNSLHLVPWHVPRERMVLRAENVHLGNTLRRKLRRMGWTTTVDGAFDEVVRRCADRPSTWLTPAIQETYRELHRRGRAYSVEVWSPDGRLIAGVFGVQTGAVFGVDSLFHTEDHASKAAMVDAASRVRAAGGVGLDCQYPAGHFRALGGEVFARADFRRLLRAGLDRTPLLATERLPVSRLVDQLSPDAVDTSPDASSSAGDRRGVSVEAGPEALALRDDGAPRVAGTGPADVEDTGPAEQRAGHRGRS